MKLLTFSLCMCLFFSSYSQTTVPAKTLVPVQVTQDISPKTNKAGSAVTLKVEKDVVVNGVTVIAANSAVTGKVSMLTKTDLRVDILSVKAVDGTTIRLNDCWIYTTIDQNPSGKFPLIRQGTQKNCYTAVDISVQ